MTDSGFIDLIVKHQPFFDTYIRLFADHVITCKGCNERIVIDFKDPVDE